MAAKFELCGGIEEGRLKPTLYGGDSIGSGSMRMLLIRFP